MAELHNMTRKQLNTWIRNLQDSIKANDCDVNRPIYEKWLKEAKEESRARQERQKAWWEAFEKGK